MSASTTSRNPGTRRPFYYSLAFQLAFAIVVGVALGHTFPAWGEAMRPLGTGFIKLVKMLIAPIVFCLVVHGIAGVKNVKHVASIGTKALVYFEVMSTIALVVGIIGMNILRPGVGMNVDLSGMDTSSLKSISGNVKQMSGPVDYFLHIIPDTFVGAFAEGQILQVLLLALLFSFSLHALGERGRPLLESINLVSECLFGAVNYVMKAAPIGAFGAIAFTVGRYGVTSIGALAYLIASYYVIAIVFVVVFLGGASALAGFNLFKLLRFLGSEIMLVLGTSSSEAALPRLMIKLERLGVPESVVGLVVPTGYTFNQDGTCLNLTTLAIFIAQATNTDLPIGAQLSLLAILLLTSKGVAAVTGGSLVVLTATLAGTNFIPVAGVAIILGIYQFISVGGAVVNAVGNAVAAIVVARWEGVLTVSDLRRALDDASLRTVSGATAVHGGDGSLRAGDGVGAAHR